MADVELLPAFKFEIGLTRSASTAGTPAHLADGAFAECSGLDLEANVAEYLEGGHNDAVVRRVGRVKLVPLVLKRGMFVPPAAHPTADGNVNGELWQWLNGMVSGQLPIPRYDGIVTIYNPTKTRALATWSFTRGLPIKVVGPSLNAKTGEIAIEELHIAHEGLILGTPPKTGAALVKAQLWPLKDGTGNDGETLVPDESQQKVTVQFNPTSLKIERQNNINKGGATTHTQRRQWASPQPATLTFELEFDTAEGGKDGQPQDVRELTRQVRQFAEPPDPTKAKNAGDAPPRVRFVWGSFHFDGIVTHVGEELDYFSPEGRPLRAKLSVSITEQDPKFEALETGPGARNASAATAPGGGPAQTGPGSSPTTNPTLAALAQAGESMQQLLSRVGALPDAWRSAMAGLDSPLELPAGQPVQIGPEAFGGGGIGVNSGFAVGADASMAASLAGALGVEVGTAASAGASVAVPGTPAVVVSAGASAGAAAGFALSAGGGVDASLNTVLSGQVSASVALARASFEVPGVAAAVDVTVDPRALGYGRSIPLRARADATTIVAATAGGRPNLSARASPGEVPLASGMGAAPWQQLPPSTPDRAAADAQQRRRDAGPDTMRWTPGR